MNPCAWLALVVAGGAMTVGRAAEPTNVLDFSSAGYGGGGVALPVVPGTLALTPSGGDDTERIQSALDAVGGRPLDGRGFRGAVVLQTSKAVTDAILADPARAAHVDVIDTRYWQYTADGTLFAPDGQGKLAFREIRNNTFGREVAVPTKAEYVYKIVREYRDKFPDKAVIAGHGGFGPLPVLMAGGSSPVAAEGGVSRAGATRDDAALLRFVAERVADVLPRMRPVDRLAGDAWCLADAARANVLLYSTAGDAIALARPLAAKQATWFNPRTGETTATQFDGAKSIAKPSAEAWLLLARDK